MGISTGGFIICEVRALAKDKNVSVERRIELLENILDTVREEIDILRTEASDG